MVALQFETSCEQPHTWQCLYLWSTTVLYQSNQHISDICTEDMMMLEDRALCFFHTPSRQTNHAAWAISKKKSPPSPLRWHWSNYGDRYLAGLGTLKIFAIMCFVTDNPTQNNTVVTCVVTTAILQESCLFLFSLKPNVVKFESSNKLVVRTVASFKNL